MGSSHPISRNGPETMTEWPSYKVADEAVVHALSVMNIIYVRFEACACRKSNANILVVQPAQDRAARMVPASLTARETGASFSKDKCVLISL